MNLDDLLLNRQLLLPGNGYNVAKTFESGQFFKYSKVPERDGYLVVSGNDCAFVRQRGSDVELNIRPESDSDYWLNFLAIDTDDLEVWRIMTSNPKLKEVYEFSEGIRVLRQDPVEALLYFIISQRNNIPRIKQCVNLLCQMTGEQVGPDLWGAPVLTNINKETLEHCRLGYRDAYLCDAANRILTGRLDLQELQVNRCSPEKAVETLMTVQGVGPKVAGCVALYGLGHKSLFPIDVWVSRAMNCLSISHNDIKMYGDAAGLVQQHIFYYMLHKSPPFVVSPR